MIKGFDQVAGGPMLERPLGILIHCPNRQDENGNIPRGCVTLKLATNLITVRQARQGLASQTGSA